MLLRNEFKECQIPEIITGGQNVKIRSNTQTHNNVPLITEVNSKINFYQAEMAAQTPESLSYNISTIHDTVHPSHVSPVPSQLQSGTYPNLSSEPNIVSPSHHRQVTSPFSLVDQNNIRQQGMAPTPNLHPSTIHQYSTNPQIVYSHQLSIDPTVDPKQIASSNFNRSHSHAGMLSSMVEHRNLDVNQLSHSFKNLTNNSSSSSSIILRNDDINPKTEINTNNTLSRFPKSLNSGHRNPNLNGSSMSLPPSNRTRQLKSKSKKMSKFLQHSLETSKSFQLYDKQISSQSSPAMRHSQSRSSVYNTDSLTPTRRMINIIEERVLIPRTGIEVSTPNISAITKKANCDPNVMRCTFNAVPVNDSLLSKTKLPFAILLHPFRDLPNLQVIKSKIIIRCRISSCRAYINPFVSFIDQKRWKCNMCLRINELSEDTVYNKSTGEYNDISRRMELRLPTVEYIAPIEYSLKSVHTPVYVFMIDISSNATLHLYEDTMSQILNTVKEQLERFPGFERSKVAFIGFDSSIHLYPFNGKGFREVVISDITSPIEIPFDSDRVIDLQVHRDHIMDLLTNLLHNVDMCQQQHNSSSCLGTALLLAKQFFGNNGGRITIFNASCPTMGEGILTLRGESKSGNISPLTPDKEFYKTLSLEFAQAQIAVDLFQLGTISCDLASLSVITRYCSGSLFYYPDLSISHRSSNVSGSNDIEICLNESRRLKTDLQRYLTRNIGFEGILRIRSSGGFNILSSHGNFFARAADLYSLANVNPDSGVAIRLGIEDNCIDTDVVFFQAALLYTSGNGERRIRIHTLCLPVSLQIDDIFRATDHQAVAAFLSKTLADRLQMTGNVQDAREALLCSLVDASVAFGKFCLSSSLRLTSFPFPYHLRLLPLYVWGMLQSECLKTLGNTADLSVAILDSWRNMPLSYFIANIHPNLFGLTNVIDLVASQLAKETTPNTPSLDSDESSLDSEDESRVSDPRPIANGEQWQPEHLHLTIQSLSLSGVYLLDSSKGLILLIGSETPQQFLKLILGIDSLSQIEDDSFFDLPQFHNAASNRLRLFIRERQSERPIGSQLFVIGTDSSVLNATFAGHLLEDDRADGSYHRFLQHVQKKVIDS